MGGRGGHVSGWATNSTHSRLSKGLDGTVRISRTIRVTPPRQRPGHPAPPVSYVVTTVEKEHERPEAASSIATSSFGQPLEAAWPKQDEHAESTVQRTFVAAPERDGIDRASPNPLSLLRSRRDSVRPPGVEHSVSFALASPQTRPQELSGPIAQQRDDNPEERYNQSALPSAGKIRRQQRFGKGLRRGGPDRGRPWVIESTTDDRVPVQPFPPVLIERRMLRCGILLLRWTVRKQRGLARWWFIESLRLRDEEAAQAASRQDSRSARSRGEQRTAPSRSRSQHRARSVERLAAEGGWTAGIVSADRALTTQEQTARAERSAFDRAMGSILRRKSVLKWAFVALKADIAARVLSRAVADCSCCVRDGRRLLRGWTSLHANWLASVESMRVAHAQKVWLRRSQQRRLLRTWQRRAEWSVPRRRRATAHYSRNAKASALSQLSQGTAISRWKRSLKCVAGRLTLLFVPVFSSPVRMLVVLNSPIALYRCSPVVRSGHGGCGIRSIAYMGGKATRAAGQGSSPHVRATPARIGVDTARPIYFTCETSESRFRQ